MIDQKLLHELFDYDPKTGIFRWKKRLANCIKVGDIAGSNHDGYVRITIKRKRHFAHNLAWIYMTGETPPHFVDHIDGNPSNNRFSNLRLATKSQNKMNEKLRKDNKIGLKGVCYHKHSKKFVTQIYVDGKQKTIGYYSEAEDAHNAYLSESKEIYKEFARAS